MAVTERDEVHELSAPMDCPRCAERDLEITRLIEQNRQIKSAVTKRLLIVIGWLLMVGIPILLVFWIIGIAIKGGGPLIELVYSPHIIVSLVIFPIAFVPIVLLIHWRSRWQKTFAVCVSTVGLIAFCLLAQKSSLEFLDYFSDVLDFAGLIPIGVIFAMSPMLVMKFWKRWKFVSRDHHRIGGDPSISTILLVTALVAASLSCFELIELDSSFNDEVSSWQKFKGLLCMLGIPAMTVGAFLVVGFYCVLRKTRPRIWVLLLVGGIVVSTVVTASTLLMMYVESGEIEPSWTFWLSIVYPSLFGSVICLALGLLSAYYLRLLGYRLRTQDDDVRIRQVIPIEC